MMGAGMMATIGWAGSALVVAAIMHHDVSPVRHDDLAASDPVTVP